MKKIFRITITYTDTRYGSTPPGNMFLMAFSEEDARINAAKYFNQVLQENGYSNVRYKLEVNLSSEKEVEDYKKHMANPVVSKMVN